MKYVALDIETTGLNASVNQVIEIGAIIDDSADPYGPGKEIKNLPRFHAYVIHQQMTWDTEALKMNWTLLQDIVFGDPIVQQEQGIRRLEPYRVGASFNEWLASHGLSGTIVGAGKNIDGFDKLFLQGMLGWNEHVRMRTRSLDPTLNYVSPYDTVPPVLYECAKRAGLAVNGGAKHRALDDAELIVLLLRQAWKAKVLPRQLEQYYPDKLLIVKVYCTETGCEIARSDGKVDKWIYMDDGIWEREAEGK